MIKKKRLNPALQIVLGYMSVILIGAFLVSLPISNTSGQWLGFVDSFFMSTSAVCVTGLTVLDVAINLTLFGQIVLKNLSVKLILMQRKVKLLNLQIKT